MKFNIAVISIVIICIIIFLSIVIYAQKKYIDNTRWEVISITDEWSNSDDSSLGEHLAEKWMKKRSGSTSDKIQERCNEIASHYIDVVSNIRKVSISKTIDTETYVIKFTSADGKIASLWLDEDGGINSISEY